MQAVDEPSKQVLRKERVLDKMSESNFHIDFNIEADLRIRVRAALAGANGKSE
jgi:hypothetical protein